MRYSLLLKAKDMTDSTVVIHTLAMLRLPPDTKVTVTSRPCKGIYARAEVDVPAHCLRHMFEWFLGHNSGTIPEGALMLYNEVITPSVTPKETP